MESRGGGSRARVLVVEDNELVQRVVVRMLPDDRFEVLVAGSREEARHRLAETPRPDLVLVDQGLPDADGVDVLIEARDRWGVRGLVMSGAEAPAGVELPWLAKPFQRDALLTAIDRLLDRPVSSPG